MRTAHDVLVCLAETLSFLENQECRLPVGSPLRHQIIARAVAVAAYGSGVENDIAAARLGKVIEESSRGLLGLAGDPAEQAVLDFLYEIGLRAAAGFADAQTPGLSWSSEM
jgi:hypothetical protein